MIRRRDMFKGLAGLVVAAPFATANASVNALPPMGWTQFEIGNHPKMAELVEVNRIVNQRIIPRDADARLPWRIVEGDASKRDGCCHDYCVTKRAMLLGRDWPDDKLSFRVVRYSADEDHMVLIANLDGKELVLDNLRPNIVTWAQSGYQIKEAQDIEHHDH